MRCGKNVSLATIFTLQMWNATLMVYKENE